MYLYWWPLRHAEGLFVGVWKTLVSPPPCFVYFLDKAKQILSNIFLTLFSKQLQKIYNTLIRIIVDEWAHDVILQNNIAHEDAEEDTFSVKD